MREEADYLIKQADANEDGSLSFEEMREKSEYFVGSLVAEERKNEL